MHDHCTSKVCTSTTSSKVNLCIWPGIYTPGGPEASADNECKVCMCMLWDVNGHKNTKPAGPPMCGLVYTYSSSTCAACLTDMYAKREHVLSTSLAARASSKIM